MVETWRRAKRCSPRQRAIVATASAGNGAAVGPDLTSLARRFGRIDILLSILAPSHVVDDKYRIVTIVTTDGQVLSGQFSGDDGETVTLLPDLLAADKTRTRPEEPDRKSQTRSIVSPMPAGLLNSFSKEEVLDLLAYLESAGDPVAANPPPAPAINASSGKQLLIDSTFFADNQRITLTMNPPVKMGPVLRPDRPWEAADMGFCVSVVQDNDFYKMWYLTESEAKYYICYATSSDGIRWEKPNLGLFTFHGSTDNNIVMTQPVETTVFLDPVAPPESRFKAIHAMNWPDAKTAGLYVHTSADGIHWTISKQRVLPVLPDTANQVFFDTRLKKYVAYIREWAQMRKIGRIEMDDVTKPWPINALDKPYYIWGEGKIPVASREAPIVFSYDEHDPPNSDHYNPACVQYPWADRAYFLFPSAFSHVSDKVDIQMATSRDGVAWTRLARALRRPRHKRRSRQLPALHGGRHGPGRPQNLSILRRRGDRPRCLRHSGQPACPRHDLPARAKTRWLCIGRCRFARWRVHHTVAHVRRHATGAQRELRRWADAKSRFATTGGKSCRATPSTTATRSAATF